MLRHFRRALTPRRRFKFVLALCVLVAGCKKSRAPSPDPPPPAPQVDQPIEESLTPEKEQLVHPVAALTCPSAGKCIDLLEEMFASVPVASVYWDMGAAIRGALDRDHPIHLRVGIRTPAEQLGLSFAVFIPSRQGDLIVDELGHFGVDLKEFKKDHFWIDSRAILMSVTSEGIWIGDPLGLTTFRQQAPPKAPASSLLGGHVLMSDMHEDAAKLWLDGNASVAERPRSNPGAQLRALFKGWEREDDFLATRRIEFRLDRQDNPARLVGQSREIPVPGLGLEQESKQGDATSVFPALFETFPGADLRLLSSTVIGFGPDEEVNAEEDSLEAAAYIMQILEDDVGRVEPPLRALVQDAFKQYFQSALEGFVWDAAGVAEFDEAMWALAAMRLPQPEQTVKLLDEVWDYAGERNSAERPTRRVKSKRYGVIRSAPLPTSALLDEGGELVILTKGDLLVAAAGYKVRSKVKRALIKLERAKPVPVPLVQTQINFVSLWRGIVRLLEDEAFNIPANTTASSFRFEKLAIDGEIVNRASLEMTLFSEVLPAIVNATLSARSKAP